MKKLIGISLVGLFAINANAQVETQNGYTTIVKNKGNGQRKVKHVPNVAPPPVIIYSPDGYGGFYESPYYGYRTNKYYDSAGVKHKVIYYDQTVPINPYYYYPFNPPYYYR